MVTPTRQTVRSALSALSDDSLNLRIRHARTAMLMAPIFSISVLSGAFATVVCWLIHPLVDPMVLWPWLAAKWLILVPRVWHARAFARAEDPDHNRWYAVFLLWLAVDGLLWGGVGWWLTPPDQPNLAALGLACVVGVAATGSFMLHMDARAAAVLQWAVLAPNVVHCLLREDQFGLFGAVSLLCLAVILKIETARAHRRMSELLRLRYTLEVVAKDREAARATAERLSETKSRFLATISHEMRTPLSGMLGLARMMKDDVARLATPERVGLLVRSGEHLLAVLNDLLDFSKIHAGHVNIEPRPFDLKDLLEEVTAVSRVSAEEKGLSLTLMHDVGVSGWVVGDPVRLRQVLHNLIGNAIKFTERGQISVRARRESGTDRVCIDVADTGIGIPEAEVARVFDAFQQAEAGRKQHGGGTGLGLTISRELCRAMGGDLSCRSVFGQGSVFTCLVDLPVQGASSDRTSLSSERDPPLLRGRVLVVEDNPINALVAEAALAQLGVEVVLMDDGARALNWLQTHEVDLIFLDCHMPGLDGWSVAAQIRQNEAGQGGRRMPIIALSASVDEAERARCLAVGMDGVLSKPFDRELMRAVLMRHLPAPYAEASVSDGSSELGILAAPV